MFAPGCASNQSADGEEPEEHKRSSNFLLSRIDQRVSSKNGGTSTGKPVSEANLMTCIERLQHDDLKSSQVRRTGVHPIFMCGRNCKVCTDKN